MPSDAEIFETWLTGQGKPRANNPDPFAERDTATAQAQGIVTAAAADIRTGHAHDLDRIRSRTAPGDQARRVGLARAHLAARARVSEQRQKFETAVEDTRFILESRLYGAGGRIPTTDEAGARRQAQLAARDINDPRDALDALNRARRDGDRIAAQAIFERSVAHESSPIGGAAWAPVVREYFKINPAAERQLADLRDLHNAVPTGLAAEVHWHVPVPDELDGLSDYQIQQLAESDLAD